MCMSLIGLYPIMKWSNNVLHRTKESFEQLTIWWISEILFSLIEEKNVKMKKWFASKRGTVLDNECRSFEIAFEFVLVKLSFCNSKVFFSRCRPDESSINWSYQWYQRYQRYRIILVIRLRQPILRALEEHGQC